MPLLPFLPTSLLLQRCLLHLALELINRWILLQGFVLGGVVLLIPQLLLACKLSQALLLLLPVLKPLALITIWGNVQRARDSSVPVLEASVTDVECRVVVDALESLSRGVSGCC
jgi:hypothetical protein